VLETRKKHSITLKYLDVQASTATMNKHRHSRCHYERNSGSTPAGMNNLHTGGPAGRQTTGSSPPTTVAASTTSDSDGKTAAATASGQTLLLEVPRPHPHTRGETSRQGRRAGGPTAGGADDLVGGENFSGCHHLSTDDDSHLPTSTAPASAGRPKAHRQVLTPVLAARTRTGPSQNTSTALAAYDVL
jgi:hypothetical protein